MDNSNDRFEELTSLYFDGEADVKQLRELAELVRSDKALAKKFKSACSVHIAMCKYYGKQCRLEDISKYASEKRSLKSAGKKVKSVLEWTKVAALVALTFGILSVSEAMSHSPHTSAKNADAISRAESDYDVKLSSDDFYTGSDFSLVKISPKSTAIPISR